MDCICGNYLLIIILIQMIKKIILLGFTLSLALSQYKDLLNVNLPESVTDVDYSPKQHYVGAGAGSKMFILNGHTGLIYQTINLDSQNKMASFSFSEDEQWLIIGFADGSAQLYQFDTSFRKFVYSDREYRGQSESTIRSVCFSRKGTFAVLGQAEGRFIVWDLGTDGFIEEQFGNNYVFGVACQDDLVAVAGGYNTEAELNLYQIGEEQGNMTINLIKKFDPQNNHSILDAFFSEDFLYTSSKGDISAYNLTSFQCEEISLKNVTDQGLSQVRVSTNDEFLVAASSANIFVKNLFDGSEQIFSSTVDSVALSQNGANLLRVAENSKGVISGLCDLGQYYDGQKCVKCEDKCTICESVECFKCASGFYLSDNTCLACMVGCLECEDASRCQQCDIQNHFVSKDEICVCEDGFYLDGETCQPCMDGCLECHDKDTCIRCDQQKGFIEDEGKCVCKPGYFDDHGVCDQCIRGCLTCQDSESCDQCDSQSHYILDNEICICNADEHFVDNGTDCVCQGGFYEDQGLCKKCMVGCDDCSEAETCNHCRDGFHLDEGVCKCGEGQYIDQDSQSCKNCNQTLEFCIECDNPIECKGCQEGIHRHLDQGKCICDDGFYPTPDTCERCSLPGCLTCDSADVCTQCDPSQHWVLNGTQCTCQQKYILINDTCVLCPVGCILCDKDQICSECDEAHHWELDGKGECQCVKGYYIDIQTCEKCMPGCLECTSADECQQCNTDQKFILVDNKCQCIPGFFEKDDKCESCQIIPRCLECISSKNCTNCVQPFKPISGQCGCDQGYFIDGNACTKCDTGCLKCTALDQCSQCDKGYVLDNGKCDPQGPKVLVIVLTIVGVLVLADISNKRDIFSLPVFEMSKNDRCLSALAQIQK